LLFREDGQTDARKILRVLSLSLRRPRSKGGVESFLLLWRKARATNGRRASSAKSCKEASVGWPRATTETAKWGGWVSRRRGELWRLQTEASGFAECACGLLGGWAATAGWQWAEALAAVWLAGAFWLGELGAVQQRALHTSAARYAGAGRSSSQIGNPWPCI